MSEATFATPVYRTGKFIKLYTGEKFDDSAVVKISYRESRSILKALVEADGAIKEAISDPLKSIAGAKFFEPNVDDHWEAPLYLTDARRSPRFVTAADSSDFLLSLSGFIVQTRASFTVCVDDASTGIRNGGGKPLDLHSKVWVRFILVGLGRDLRKVFTEEESNKFYEIMHAASPVILKRIAEIYEKSVSDNIDKPELNIETFHTLTALTTGVSASCFNSVVSDYALTKDLVEVPPLRWEGAQISICKTDSQLSTLANGFFDNKIEADPKFGTKKLLKTLDAEHPGKYHLVALDDRFKSKAVFLAEIFDKHSKFVGVALEPTAEYDNFDKSSPDGYETFYAPSSAAANVSSNSLIADIATGF